MTEQKREIGIFDAIYSLMEHQHRLTGAELSAKRLSALQEGNVALFIETTEQLSAEDQKLNFILQKRAEQDNEFDQRGIVQPGISMAEKLHEFMVMQSGGTLPRMLAVEMDAPTPQISNGHAPIEHRVIRVPDQLGMPNNSQDTDPSHRIFLPAQDSPSLKDQLHLPNQDGEVEEDESGAQKIEQESAETDSLAKFKSLIPEDLNWDIPSRTMTEKLKNGKYPYGIRQARMMVASVKYDPNLERINLTRPPAVQEAYAEGDSYASITKITTQIAVETFVNDFLNRKGKKLTALPVETQDTIKRVKEDPVLGPLTQTAVGRNRLLEYALYHTSLSTILLAETIEQSPSEEKSTKKQPKNERKENGKKVANLEPHMYDIIQTYLRIYIANGWPSDMRRAVAVEKYKDEIPAPATVSELVRETVIKNKMQVVALHRGKAEKRFLEALEQEKEGTPLSQTFQSAIAETAKMLGIEKLTLTEVYDLLNKKCTPDQLKQKYATANSAQRAPSEPVQNDRNEQESKSFSSKEDERSREDLQKNEETAFFTLLALDEKGLAFATIDEACDTIFREELQTFSDPRERSLRLETLCKQITSNFNKAINRIESTKNKLLTEDQIHLELALDWLQNQEIDGDPIYAGRETSTIRRIGLRQVELNRFRKKSQSQGFTSRY